MPAFAFPSRGPLERVLPRVRRRMYAGGRRSNQVREGGRKEKFPSRQENSQGSEQTACSLLSLNVAWGRGCSGNDNKLTPTSLAFFFFSFSPSFCFVLFLGSVSA